MLTLLLHYRLHFLKGLFHLYLLRSTMFIQPFLAQRKQSNFYFLHHNFVAMNIQINIFFFFIFSDKFNCRVIFGMLIALPITLVYYILLGL